MEDKNHASFEEQYYSLLNHVRSMEPSLKLLHRDLLLSIEHQYKFTYAVDFHEVWEFANPTNTSTRTDTKIKYTSEEVMREKQISRAGLFYGLEPGNHSVLLPPYITELNNKVALVKAGILDVASRLDNKYAKKLSDIANDEPVRNALDEFRISGQISPALTSQILKLLEEKVGELFYLISGATGHGLEIIRSIFSDEPPKVQMPSSKWPDLETLIQKTMQIPNSEWYTRFSEIRQSDNASTSNLHDAKAIDLVLALNKHFIQTERKELVYIVSDTSTMKRIMKEKPKDFSMATSKNYIWTKEDGICIELPNVQKPVPIFRPIEVFYYSILLRDASSKAKTIENVENELKYIYQVDIWLKSFDEFLANCGKCLDVKERMTCKILNPCLEMKDELLTYNRNFSDRRNILLAVNRFPVLQPYWEQVESQRSMFEEKLTQGVLTLIQFLSRPRSSFLESEIKDKEQELVDIMESDLKDALIDAINAVVNISTTYKKEISEGLDKFSRTHYRIHFRDDVVVSTLDKLEKARYSGNVYNTSQAIRELLNRAFEKSLGSEKWLLWGVLLICYRLPDRAINLTSLMLRDAGITYRSEYRYLRALAYYELKNLKQVINECQKGITEYAGDARFYNLCGLAISRLIEFPDNTDYSWNNAIDYARQAHTIITKFSSEDISLQGTIANNLAYFYYRRGEPNDIKQALYYAEELQQLIPSFAEIPEFLNTIGCVFKELALREKNKKVWEQYKIRALNDLKKAYELAKDTIAEPSEIDEYEKDLREAEQQLLKEI